MGFDTLIVNGTVVTASDTYAADVAVTDGKIAAVGAIEVSTELRRVCVRIRSEDSVAPASAKGFLGWWLGQDNQQERGFRYPRKGGRI